MKNLSFKDIYLFLIACLLIIILFFVYVVFDTEQVPEVEEQIQSPLGTMILIEYKDTVGLANFVSEMEKRSIPGLLMVTPEFVEENCEDIKEVIKHDIEIVGSNVEEPFWGMPYEDQKTRMVEIKEGIELCTGVPVRIISSRYMASDMNTVKAAEDLGIPYITARGTTGTKATVYQPEGYNVKILSVSNIEWVPYKYGSLCDYSFYERAGSPEDMRRELERALEPLSQKEIDRLGAVHRVTPVSHTSIGGYLERWMTMWNMFWDDTRVEWVDLDTLMKDPDWTMPLWQIPINMNNPYTEEKMRPEIPYEDELKIMNPCTL